MKTISQLRRMIESAGGSLEDDGEGSSIRIFQAVAPENQLWKCDDIHCVRIDWAIPATYFAEQNEETFNDVKERLSFGLRPMTEQEKELYAEN